MLPAGSVLVLSAASGSTWVTVDGSPSIPKLYLRGDTLPAA
jgi:hypothetical protein